MPSIVDVVDAIAAILAARTVPVPVAFGQQNISVHGAPPSVVFVPRGDRFSAPTMRNNSPGRTHNSAATRGTGLQARIWGAAEEGATGTDPDVKATELLVDKVIIAIRDAVGSNGFALEDGEWADTSGAEHGRLYLLNMRVFVPVVPAEEDASETTTTFTRVLNPADDPAGTPASITTTVELATDVTGTPAP